jgi:hypothetical protein
MHRRDERDVGQDLASAVQGLGAGAGGVGAGAFMPGAAELLGAALPLGDGVASVFSRFVPRSFTLLCSSATFARSARSPDEDMYASETLVSMKTAAQMAVARVRMLPAPLPPKT